MNACGDQPTSWRDRENIEVGGSFRLSCALKVIRERESSWTTNLPSAGWINSAEKLKRTELLAARNEGRRGRRPRRQGPASRHLYNLEQLPGDGLSRVTVMRLILASAGLAIVGAAFLAMCLLFFFAI